jgi:predicted phage terminase large subunit-like protein
MSGTNKTYGPASEKQRLILQDTTTDVILIGGGAGGGKSRICLTKNLDGIDDPAFRCTIFRRTRPELFRQGALVDESKQIYPDFGGDFKSQAAVWRFPSGASIAFAAIATDDDLGSWQGSQLVRILIDEAADRWTEKQVLFLLSRLRSAHSKIYPQMILTCNPDIDSFLKGWVDFCLDPETGVPLPGTEHRIRWFTTQDNKVYWADSPEECFELYGKPRGMVYARGMAETELKKHPPDKLFMPKSFRFIASGVFDNPYLLPPRNNSYLANLLSQPYVNQLKFLHGSWTAKESGALYFDRKWVEVVDFAPVKVTGRIRAWDFAASEKTTSTDPDYSVGVKMSRDRYGIYYVEDVVRFQARTDKVLKTVVETAQYDGIEECDVCIPIDPAASGKTAAHFYLRILAEAGIGARTKATTGHSGKLTRFKPLCVLAETGALKIVRAPWNDAFFDELESFTGERSQKYLKDDQVDAAADAFTMLARSVTISDVVIPSLTQASPIPTL